MLEIEELTIKRLVGQQEIITLTSRFFKLFSVYFFIMIPHVYISRLYKAVLLLSLLAFLFPSKATSQSSTESESYVVIGAFAIEKNAKRLISYAKEKGIQAEYQIHPNKDLYYVYEQVENSFKERRRIKEVFPEFYDVWVYEGKLGRNYDQQSNLADTPSGVDSGSLLASNSISEASSGIMDSSSEPNLPVEESMSEEGSAEVNESNVTEEVESDESEPVKLEKKEGIYYLYLNTVNSKNLKEVKGKVNVIDPVRAKQLKEAKSHEIVGVRDPKNGSKTVKLATQIFGFREVQQTINLDEPVNDSTSSYVHTIGDSIIVDFELQRYKKGDVIIMYNVYFFKDAAIMKPESIYELNSLLDMLRENEKLVVQLHGHTNGNSHGKVLHLDLEDKNFFSLNANHKEDNGTAKKLSEYRAYTIQHWLMEQGISEERIEIKGWGGKKMIYDKHDTQAYKNVRVEVEILED